MIYIDDMRDKKKEKKSNNHRRQSNHHKLSRALQIEEDIMANSRRQPMASYVHFVDATHMLGLFEHTPPILSIEKL